MAALPVSGSSLQSRALQARIRPAQHRRVALQRPTCSRQARARQIRVASGKSSGSPPTEPSHDVHGVVDFEAEPGTESAELFFDQLLRGAQKLPEPKEVTAKRTDVEQQQVQRKRVVVEQKAAPEEEPGLFKIAAARGADRDLAYYLALYNAAGPYADAVGPPTSYDPITVPIDPATSSVKGESSIDIAVYVTMPTGAQSKELPVVFMFNAFAMGFQRCEWYFDYASRLAGWGYAVVQYETKSTLRFVNGKETETIVAFLLDWASEKEPLLAWNGESVAPEQQPPSPDFSSSALDRNRIAFVGHSKGGSDAIYMMAKQPADVLATSFTVDAVDLLFAASRALLQAVPGPEDRAACLVRAEVRSWFSLLPTTENVLLAANSYCQSGCIAGIAADAAHFSWVEPGVLRSIRVALRVIAELVGQKLPESLKQWWLMPRNGGLQVDTCRSFRTRPWAPNQPGVYDQSAALLVAWMEGTYRPKPDRNVRELAGPGAYFEENHL